ncbi:Trk system potassium transporter TrkA [Rhodopirellula baltica]|uniref:Trk system potassium uptake protein TrkA n=3 Tax=Rhodopirellula baltica TaxID=265606 RepID=Q7UG97_RHOBA|nr:Trk system potassium transporter TrkA [Rhodopirellula baltica]EGF26874.1 potassium transporter peripheral membrane component [Rhodopirellula baltica WH47]ELP31631.1 potassium transporter peripheral membrane component [Rhodopirellula baltica SWK14]CAD78432.1 TRK potassium uptake system protein (trkA-2) [Rhodopirellula baltica SH 1]HBE62032.1 Trk system potassium transporter TrkA [Rhodopirellula baltica]
MRILTLGGGTVGRWIADMLCRRRHSVTLIDSDPEIVRSINSELDVRAIEGNASQSTVLFSADVLSADLCLAVTGDDEVNIVAASMAKALGARRAIARVYAPAFRDLSTFDYQRHFQIDSLLSLEQLSASELARAIRNPDAIPLEHFARGQLQVYEMDVAAGSAAAGKKLMELQLPPSVRVGSLAREGRMWIASGADETRAGDRVSLVGMPDAVSVARQIFGGEKRRRKQSKVMIAGGGETGYHLAGLLGREDFRTVLLEQDAKRCEQLAKLLPDVTVVHANANRRSVLEDEGGGTVDYFVGCTGNDENNIMAGVEARELGASRVMCVVGRPDYANVVGKLGIDLAVSERDVVARQILGFLNEGAIISQSKLPNGSIGVYELEILEGSAVTQASLANLPLAGRCLIAAIQRDGFVRVPTASDVLEVNDIIVALIDLSDADEVLSLFHSD